MRTVLHARRLPAWALCLGIVPCLGCQPGGPQPAKAAGEPTTITRMVAAATTDTVAHDPDDPAIWVHPTDTSRSLVLATDKVAVNGAVYVFGIDGRVRQVIGHLDRPNNVDIQTGVRLGAETLDVALVTERKQRRLRIFRIRPDGSGLDDLAPAGLPVLSTETGAAGEPMGVALYRRPTDGEVFPVVAPKTGPAHGYLWQYHLVGTPAAPRLVFVRRFGAFSGIGPNREEGGEIEAIVIDDELGFVYYADERYGLRKWDANPDRRGADTELAVFGTDGYLGDREGLAIYPTGPGRGYIVSSDQVPGATRLHVYPREGGRRDPHNHERVAILPTESDETDGLDVAAGPVGPYPAGVLIMMNSTPRNFLIYDWRLVSGVLKRLTPSGY